MTELGLTLIWVNEITEDNDPKTGGGVGIYIKYCIQHDAFDLSYLNQSNQNIEVQCIRVEKPNNKRMVVINTYRPPQKAINLLL